ncbi:hypothetical protein AaE_007631 [Aphanomyces astaci]|uniref:Uncharacterized protein n=1 Tax=Aphanomyces astaci TaxID=112090 RepID=A0A6A5AA99_APHAT|nr:hypothetical protein AaE_007631 [Aphanomyces astaci]
MSISVCIVHRVLQQDDIVPRRSHLRERRKVPDLDELRSMGIFVHAPLALLDAGSAGSMRRHENNRLRGCSDNQPTATSEPYVYHLVGYLYDENAQDEKDTGVAAICGVYRQAMATQDGDII